VSSPVSILARVFDFFVKPIDHPHPDPDWDVIAFYIGKAHIVHKEEYLV